MNIPTILMFQESLAEVMNAIDEICVTLNHAADKIFNHNLRPCNFCDECKTNMHFAEKAALHTANCAMHIYTLISTKTLKTEVDTLMAESNHHHDYDSIEANDNRAYMLNELRNSMQYSNKFLVATFMQQQQQLLKLTALFNRLPLIQPEVYYEASQFINLLKNFEIMPKFLIFMRQLDLDDIYHPQNIRPVFAGYLREERIHLLMNFILPKPDFTAVE